MKEDFLVFLRKIWMLGYIKAGVHKKGSSQVLTLHQQGNLELSINVREWSIQSPGQLLGDSGSSEHKCAHMSERSMASCHYTEILSLIIKLGKQHILSEGEFWRGVKSGMKRLSYLRSILGGELLWYSYIQCIISTKETDLLEEVLPVFLWLIFSVLCFLPQNIKRPDWWGIAEFTLEQAVPHKHLIHVTNLLTLRGRKMLHHSPFPHLLFKLHNQTSPISQGTVNIFSEAFYQSMGKGMTLIWLQWLVCDRPRVATSQFPTRAVWEPRV